MKLTTFSASPARSYLAIFLVILLWIFAFIMIVVGLSNRPHVGASFEADIPGSAIVVVHVDEGGVADRAGLELGARITHLSAARVPKYQLSGFEAVIGRHQLHNYEMIQRTVQAKAEVWEALTSDRLTLYTDDDRRFELIPERGRGVFAVSLKSYTSLLQSLIVLIVTVGIWAFASPSKSVALLAVSGLGLATNMICGAYLGTSDLTITPKFFAPIINLAALGFTVFSYGLLALLLRFPNMLTKWPLGEALFVVGLCVQAMITFELVQLPLHSFQLANLLPIPVAVVASQLQWRRSRNDPIGRASVMWFALSIYGIVALVTLLYSIPVMLKIQPILSPHVVNFSLAFIFFGIAAGTLKYRLFDIHRVWAKSLAWLLGGFVVVLVDMAMVWQFSVDQSDALLMALLFAGWVYFPIRQFILRYFLGTQKVDAAANIPDLITTFSGQRDSDEIEGRFLSFLKRAYEADEISAFSHEPIERAKIENSGLALRVPDVSGRRSVQIIGKTHGRQLFSRQDVEQMDIFLPLVRNMKTAAQNEHRVREKERERIVRDLHDDVGGRLLSLVYQADEEPIADEARKTLAALREVLVVVENTEAVDFEFAWWQFCSDATERFSNNGRKLEVTEDLLSPRVLTARENLNLKRIMLEITSNALKYGAGNKVKYHAEIVSSGWCRIIASNLTDGDHAGHRGTQRGLINIENRLGELGGTMKVSQSTDDEGDWFHIELILPLAGPDQSNPRL